MYNKKQYNINIARQKSDKMQERRRDLIQGSPDLKTFMNRGRHKKLRGKFSSGSYTLNNTRVQYICLLLEYLRVSLAFGGDMEFHDTL